MVEVKNLAVEYTRGDQKVRAVAGVDLSVGAGEILGLVGESGCGKSTLGKAIVGILQGAEGEVTFDGQPVTKIGRGQRDAHFRNLQMIFQDPYGSLNPRRKIGDQIADGPRIGGVSKGEAIEKAASLLERVGLPRNAVERYPHQFSGGQRQRIAIARALAISPKVIIADEPISALDTSSQAAVANLLVNLVEEFQMGLIFISHDLSIVRRISDRVAVMYLGKIVETGKTEEIWNFPAHPYTKALMSAIPHADGKALVLMSRCRSHSMMGEKSLVSCKMQVVRLKP
ncbi:MAG: ABC transporter ATP-binding protein [Actinobacteria bacterium]|nr:ABC transporter ATP-binding protein [Actinomycetota bacterium]